MGKHVLLVLSLQLFLVSLIFAQNQDTTENNTVAGSQLTERNQEGQKSVKQDKNINSENSERFYQIKINLKILDDCKKELVNTDWNLATVSGKPVSIHLKGNNLFIKADMTPYYSDKKSILLMTQANVRLKPDDSEVSKFYSTVNSLPINLGEKALFFPLGLLDEKMENISSCVLEIEVQPYDNIEDIKGPGSKQVGEEIKKE